MGGVPAPPRNRPLRTALAPATLSTVTTTEPPAATVTGTCIQAPALKLLLIAIVLVGPPLVMVTFSRRVVASQSTA